MRRGERGDYHWIESADIGLRDLLTVCPEAVLGRCVAIAALDGGPILRPEVESERGWIYSNGVAYVPAVSSVAELPYDDYDE